VWGVRHGDDAHAEAVAELLLTNLLHHHTHIAAAQHRQERVKASPTSNDIGLICMYFSPAVCQSVMLQRRRTCMSVEMATRYPSLYAYVYL
jgi:hypothetical protein